jgi:hypothetical protein
VNEGLSSRIESHDQALWDYGERLAFGKGPPTAVLHRRDAVPDLGMMKGPSLQGIGGTLKRPLAATQPHRVQLAAPAEIRIYIPGENHGRLSHIRLQCMEHPGHRVPLSFRTETRKARTVALPERARRR